jgi:hypothetical protein
MLYRLIHGLDFTSSVDVQAWARLDARSIYADLMDALCPSF